MQVSPRELEARIARVDLGPGHGPYGRESRAVPPDHDGAGRGGVPEPVGVLPERSPGVTVGRHRAAEVRVQTGGQFLRPPQAGRIVRQPPQREDTEVASRDDVGVEPRPPELDQRWVVPRGRQGSLDARVDREQRRPGHAVLQARPRRAPERPPAARQPRIEFADAPPEPKDPRSREVEPRGRHRPIAVIAGATALGVRRTTGQLALPRSVPCREAGRRRTMTSRR